MSIKKYTEYLVVLPEDDANRQIAIGFFKDSNLIKENAFTIRGNAKGWKKALDKFNTTYVPKMKRQEYSELMVVLLIDFDRDENRLSYVKNQIPEELKDRVFVLGVFSEPENLRSEIKRSFENIGETLAKDCADDTNELWGHDLLKHNKTELDRMVLAVKPFLFN